MVIISAQISFSAVVRKGGFEPPRLSAPPPQDGVSASSTTSALAHSRPFFDGNARLAGTMIITDPSRRPGFYRVIGIVGQFRDCGNRFRLPPVHRAAIRAARGSADAGYLFGKPVYT